MKKEKTEMNFSTKRNYDSGKRLGCTDMGIPPFNQKVKNLEKLSNIAMDMKKPMKGTDKFEKED